ncbi:MAG: protein translocase subunit SecD [Candidatus Fermentibacteraceae bacterium]
MKRADKWRIWSSVALFVTAVLMIWPTIRWYSIPSLERDKAEASAQPETSNPYFRSLLDQMQADGGEAEIQRYRDMYDLSRGTIKLGLDLQGGMYLAYTVEPTPGLDPDEALDQALEVIRNRIDEFGVSEPSITRQGDDRIVVQLPGVRDPARARAIVERQALLEFKVVAYPNHANNQTAPSSVQTIRDIESALEGTVPAPAVETTETPEPEAFVDSTTALVDTASTDSSAFSLPSETETPLSQPQVDDLTEPLLLEASGRLGSLITIANENFRPLRISPGDWVLVVGENLEAFQDIVNTPEARAILERDNLSFAYTRPEEIPGIGQCVGVFLVPTDVTRGWENRADLDRPYYRLTGANLNDVRIQMGSDQAITNEPGLILEFDDQGAENWERITGENVEQRVSIILDGSIYSVATIRERISGSGTRLSGGFNVNEARDLRLVLKAGSLPARLDIAEEQTVGPSLGRRSIGNGVLAGAVALLLITGFMIVYYGLSGFIAVLALVFDMLIIFGFLCFPGPLAQLGLMGMNSTLTLPGIAGIILTIGMAVDASVLIYERIREERRTGKGIRSAVDSGYNRAFVTILDANLTTLITAMVLYRFGTGPIRGFAVTLSIGILASMFCSLVFTRAFFAMLLAKAERMNIGMGSLAFIRDAHWDITKNRRKVYIASLTAIVIGAIGYFANGGLNLSIDFTGGLETNVTTTAHETGEDLANSLSGMGLQGVQVQALSDWTGEGNAFVVRTSTSNKDQVYAALGQAECMLMEEQEGEEETAFIKQIGPRVGTELRSQAVNAIMIAMFFIILYIWYRFQFKWGVAAVVALVHDILITLGILAILRVEVSLTIVAALLTIVGYSINDTIVVFDRIREDARLRKGRTFEEVVNKGINETLSRTIITSATTFTAVLMLFIFAPGILRDFALTLMIGVLVGTFSSIFVASPILIDWHAKMKNR